MIIENEFPILEYSTERDAVINPKKGKEPFPRLCIMTFFREIFDAFVNEHHGEKSAYTYRKCASFQCTNWYIRKQSSVLFRQS